MQPERGEEPVPMTLVRRSAVDKPERRFAPAGLFPKLYWKLIGLIVTAGVFAGLTAAVIDGAFARSAVEAHSNAFAPPEVGMQAVLSDSDAADANRLEDRNRRLEALVAVLRQQLEQQRTAGHRKIR